MIKLIYKAIEAEMPIFPTPQKGLCTDSYNLFQFATQHAIVAYAEWLLMQITRKIIRRTLHGSNIWITWTGNAMNLIM